MSDKKNIEQAFPVFIPESDGLRATLYPGMTKRELIAAILCAGILANRGVQDQGLFYPMAAAVEKADDLLERLAK